MRSAFWRFPAILKSTYHEIIPCLIQCLTELRRNGLEEIVRTLVNYLVAFSNLYTSESHPYRGLLQAVAQLDVNAEGLLLEAHTKQRKQLYCESLGEDHLAVIGIGRFRHTSAGQKPDHRPWEVVQQAIDEIDRRCGPTSRLGIAEIDTICAGLYAARRTDEAEAAYSILVGRLESVSYPQWVWKTLEAAHYLGRLRYDQGKFELARDTWQKGVELASGLNIAHEYYWMPVLLESLADVHLDLAEVDESVALRGRLDTLRKRVLARAQIANPAQSRAALLVNPPTAWYWPTERPMSVTADVIAEVESIFHAQEVF